MNTRHVVAYVCAALFPATALLAQNTGVAPTFTFRPGQTVYVTAFHTIEHSVARSSKTIPPANLIDSHLPAELRIRKDFDKRRVYKLVDKASEADFVFLVLIDDSAAEGLAVAPGVFAEQKAQLNLETLREAAYVRSTIGPLKIHNLGRISDRLVTRFHDAAARARPIP